MGNLPVSLKEALREQPENQTQKPNRFYIPGLLILACVVGYFAFNPLVTPPAKNYIIHTANWGDVDLRKFTPEDLKNLRAYFVDLKKNQPALFAELTKNYDNDDMWVISKIFGSKGWLLDLANLSKALNLIDRVDEDLRDAIVTKICEAIPTLCGGKNKKAEEKTTEKVTSTPLGSIKMSVGLYNVLVSARNWKNEVLFTSFEDVAELYKKEGAHPFLKIRNMGLKRLRELEGILESRGLIPKTK